MRRWPIVAATALVLAWTAHASAGWVIDQAVVGAPGDGGKQQVVLQANRMKTLILGPDGQPGVAYIVDLDTETLTHVDYAARSYTTAPVAEYVQTMKAMQQRATQQMSDAMKQMESAMKDLPPEQRQAMEQAMRQRLAGAGGQQQCRERKIELRATGQVATIAGFQAVRHDLLADGARESEVWIARGLGAWRELDPQKLQRFATEMSKFAACGAGDLGDQATWRTVTEGYPVRTVDPAGTTVEVVKAVSRPVPAAEFQAPPGFTRKTLQEMMAH